MISSRVSKLRELQSHDKVMDVITLWNTTDDDIETISNKTSLPKREVEMILLTVEATKLLGNQKEITIQKPNKPIFIKIGAAYYNVDKISSFRGKVDGIYNSELWIDDGSSDNKWRMGNTAEDIVKILRDNGIKVME